MRRIPISLVLVGILFTLLDVRVAGQDIFIDAVGYLVAWNGLRVLEKTNQKIFLWSAPFSLILVFICTIQLFLKGDATLVLINTVRIVVEILFYAQLYYGFLKLGEKDDIQYIKPVIIGCITLCELSLITKLIISFIHSSSDGIFILNEVIYYTMIIVIAGSFLWFRHVFRDKIENSKEGIVK